ncbi:NEW3 domain-containing protein [Deinococcus hohokamensis]|uniref:NEW3 domain-containing protein n=1 Tax=Deinococcus hohokamensis TaxID=309883 RepID=A0ABV9I8T0_9DEIO
MRRALLALTLLLTSGAQALRLSAPAGEQTVSAAEPVTLSFQIYNDTPAEWSGTPSLDLQPGWGVLFAPEALQLAPGETQVVLLPVTAPARAAAGVYSVTLKAENLRATALLRIAPRRDVSVQALAGDRVVLDGKVDTSFQVVNSGNMSETLDLSADPLGLKVNPARVTLAPGASATVAVTGTLPPSKDTTHRITLKVQGQGGLTRTARSTSVALLTELPLAERALTMRGQARFSVGPSAHAHLALSGRVHPSVPGTVDLTVSDQTWRVRYQEQAFTVTAGHLTHAGLALQPGASLLGVGGTLRQGLWRAEASAGTDQGAFAGGLTVGYTGLQVGGSLGLVTSPRGTTLAADVSGRGSNLRGWASGALDLARSAPKVAFGVAYQDRLNAASFSASYCAPGFLGQTDADLTVKAEARHQFRKDLTGSVSAAYQRDPVTTGAPANVTVAGRLSSGRESLDVSVKANGGQTTDARVNYQKGGWHTSVNWAPDTVVVQTKTAVPLGPVLLRPTVGAQLNLKTATLRPALGLGADWEFQGGTANAGIMSPTSAGGPWTVSGGVNMKVQNADLAVSGALDVGGAQPRTQWRAVLSYPVELVTGRRNDVGRIEGRLQRADGQPLAGLRLRAGQLTTITDAAGRFVFPDVAQGQVQVDLVNRDDAAGLRARPALPLAVTVMGGQTTVVNVQLSPGATVQGRVVLDWPAPEEVAGKLLVPDAPALATLLIRLSGPEASYEAPLAEDGTFSLSGVQPGVYDVLVSIGGKTLLATAHLSTTTLTVPEDGTLQVALPLLPVTQEVQIEDGGELKLK